jgi:integrase
LIGSLSALLTEIRRRGWDVGLPPDAVIYPEDFPIRLVLLPRAVSEHIIAQLEDPANFARFGDPVFELITLILIRTGLRISDALALSGDCLACDANTAPYLRYVNYKMKREALVPIDEQLEKAITAQRETVREAHRGSSPLLFPRPVANIDGTRRRISGTYQKALDVWLQDCESRDRSGALMHITAHRFRHSLGTTLINKDVPQEVVRKILDHDSHAMTAHYGFRTRRCDDTRRRRARSTPAARTSNSTPPARWPTQPGPTSGSHAEFKPRSVCAGARASRPDSWYWCVSCSSLRT